MTTKTPYKIAFVMPWYGDKIAGGAESEARNTMKRLVKAGYDVEVLTTCIKDFFADWGKNQHRAGVTEEGGITVRRFRVQGRNRVAFERVNWKFMHMVETTAEEELTWLDNCFKCPDLYAYIAKEKNNYIYFFIPYLFPSTVYGCQIAPERSVVIPCLHDEGYLYSRMQQVALSKPRMLLFHARAEKGLAQRLLGEIPEDRSCVMGGGIDTEIKLDGINETVFREKFDLVDKQFVLYAGRKDAGKNVPYLLELWGHYIERTGSDAQLIFIGPGSIKIPKELQKHARDLGYVSLSEKWQAYQTADILCQPSVNESFSIVMMESWVAGTPTLVNGRCAATRQLTRDAKAGLYFTNKEEFVGTLNYLWANPQVARQMGENGRAFVLANYQWDQVIGRYEEVIQMISAELQNEKAETPI